MTMKLKPDKRLRDLFFTPESYCHPAKAHLGMMMEIIERYTKPGDVILDPMAGVGATLIGALMGRNIICVELESHFITPMKASWEKMRQSPMLGCELGQGVILRGDARCLPLGSVDSVITSPPFADQVPVQDRDFIAKYRRVDGSPGGFGKALSSGGYTRPVDVVVTSPPYGEAQAGGGISALLHGKGDYPLTTKRPSSVYDPTSHSQNTENIGNQRGEKYWESMTQVYAECHRVLWPGGLMVLVLKGFTRDHQYVDLPQQTAGLVATLGFSLVDQWQRELWGLSFWRTLQKRQGHWDERLRYEQVMAFRAAK